VELLAALPSPPDNVIDLGPLSIRAYGLAIGLGVIAAVSIARRRWSARGNDPDDITTIATWSVPAGLVGARLYHVVTDLDRFRGDWVDVFAIWKGGLGIPGGLLVGAVTGAIVARRRGISVPDVLDAVAPAIPVAQAIGRLGNWFNQELFGRPTDLPWGLEIDPEHRPDEFLQQPTFHPTFLYEGLWNLSLALLLVVLSRRRALRPGQLFTLYVGGYALGRLWVEALRVDEATTIGGVRVNILVSLVALLAATTVAFVRRGRAAAAPAAEEISA